METDERAPRAPGEAAHEAIKKHFPSLVDVVATGDILTHLYSRGMVDDSTFDVVTSPTATLSSSQKGIAVLKSVQITVKAKPDSWKFDVLCSILKSEGNQAELANELAGKPIIIYGCSYSLS